MQAKTFYLLLVVLIALAGASWLAPSYGKVGFGVVVGGIALYLVAALRSK